MWTIAAALVAAAVLVAFAHDYELSIVDPAEKAAVFSDTGEMTVPVAASLLFPDRKVAMPPAGMSHTAVLHGG